MIDNEKRKNVEGAIFLVLFCLTIPAANWMIGNVGTVCAPSGPCLVPVAPGVMAPSGVLMVGAALVLRDLVHRASNSASARSLRAPCCRPVLRRVRWCLLQRPRSCCPSLQISLSIRRLRADALLQP